MDDRIRSLERKNHEWKVENQQLWSELMRAKERESNLERILMLAFNFFAPNGGLNMFGNQAGASSGSQFGAQIARDLLMNT